MGRWLDGSLGICDSALQDDYDGQRLLAPDRHSDRKRGRPLNDLPRLATAISLQLLDPSTMIAAALLLLLTAQPAQDPWTTLEGTTPAQWRLVWTSQPSQELTVNWDVSPTKNYQAFSLNYFVDQNPAFRLHFPRHEHHAHAVFTRSRQI